MQQPRTRPSANLSPAVAALALVLTALAARASGGAAEHPQDGPHVDLRVEIDEPGVTLKIQLNLAGADAFVEPARELLDRVHPVEETALEADLAAFFGREVDVLIDGIEVAPLVQRFDLYEADSSLVALFPRFGARALTTLRLDLGYAAKSPPEEVRIVWRPFPPDLASAPFDSDTDSDEDTGTGAAPLEILARVAAAGVEKVVPLAPDAPEILWDAVGARRAESVRFLAVPAPAARPSTRFSLASLACLALALAAALAFALRPRADGARWRLGLVLALLVASWATRGLARVPLGPARSALPSADEARAIFRPLHANIYRAFDYTDPGDVYDALARSVEGPLLERLYEEVYASLVQAEAEGAVGRVQRVDVLASEPGAIARDPDGRARFELTAHWRVEGVVFHWNHSHWRTQEARARYVVRAGPDSRDGWRIAASELLEQRVVSAEPGGPTGKDLAQPFEMPDEL